MINILSDLYFIEMECINNSNTFGLEIGEHVYRYPVGVNPGTERFTKNINEAWMTNNLEEINREAHRIFENGNFTPIIRVIKRSIDPNIVIRIGLN